MAYPWTISRVRCFLLYVASASALPHQPPKGPERAMTDVVERTETAAQRLLDATRAILPVVKASGEQGERERQLPAQVARAMAEAGVARMLAPRSVGGLEIDPITQLDVIFMLARA